jgi:multiple sugar transport system substrate-binding protein
MTWTYGPAGWCADLNEFINDPHKTNPGYNWDDVVGNLRDACSWSGVAGDALGGSGSKQWCMPWGFELNSVTYNMRYFKEAGLTPPKDLPEMSDQAKWFTDNPKDWSYGIGTRGSRSWATIHPGFMSAYANYGLVDFDNNGGKLKAAMNSDASKAFHKEWVKMISHSGPKNWSGYTWYEVGNDIGAGASAMIFDADILGYFFNGNPENKEAGNFGFHGFTPNPAASAPTPNVWIWSLAMSNFSKDKDATWYWMQWANGPENAMFGGVEANQVNPVRSSVWASGDFDAKVRGTSPGYMEQYESSIGGSEIKFTPQPLFFETTTEWAAALQEMQTGSNVDETLDKLAGKIDGMMKDVGLA